MAKTFDQLPVREALMEIARNFYQRGWMAGTAGNLSGVATRDQNGGASTFWITGSGLPKGHLESSDFLRIGVDNGEVCERSNATLKPSAETAIHRAIYRLFPEAGACLHVHTVDACLATQSADADATLLRLPPLEMIKGLGIWDENPIVDLSLYTNHGDVARIAAEINNRADELRKPSAIPALMIRNHGITVWAPSLQEAYNRVECMEYVFSFMARR